MSALFGIAYTATLAAGKTLVHGASGRGQRRRRDAEHLSDHHRAAGGAVRAAGGTVNGQIGFHVNLGSARRFVRFTWTPDLNNTDDRHRVDLPDVRARRLRPLAVAELTSGGGPPRQVCPPPLARRFLETQ